MRRCAVALASLVLFGCGISGARVDDEEKAGEALSAYFDALKAKDWRRACGLLSDQGLVMREWEQRGGCEKEIAESGSWVAPNTLAAMKAGDYTVEVEDGTAMVTPEGTGSYTLVLEGEEWRLLEPN